MKGKTSLAISAACLAVLLAAPAAQATDIASRPLKASVLAKPNLIFGLDDSGSMDGEVILPTNDGALWWDYNAQSGWASGGTMHFNSAGNASTQWRKMIYLFPNGTGTGNRVYSDGTNDHFAIPPTAQFAFLRSSAYNPLYYNPAVTYKPWSPAYSGGDVTPVDATSTAAKSHPTQGTGTFNVQDTLAESTTAEWTFVALPGMLLPGTAKVCETTCTTWPEVSTLGWATSGSDYVVPASKKYRVSMSYHPATYYQQESCTVASDGSCVAAPDGSTLKRYEIKSGNTFPAPGRSYADELQNFANWWQYYRKRKLMLNAAMGQVLETLSGIRMGVVHFNNRPALSTRVEIYDADDSDAADNGLAVAGIFYSSNKAGGTPTRETLVRIGKEYMADGGPIEYACQRNNAFILTDGFANVADLGDTDIPDYDAEKYGVPLYDTTYSESLAEIAHGYYAANLRPLMTAGKVPPTALDPNENLHMNTYGLSLGARGMLYQGDASVPPTTDAWTAPTQNRHPSAVDDLWHAALNSRGKMYLASTPTETAAQIQAGLTDMLSQVGAQGGVAVSTVNLSRGDGLAYFGKYDPAGWMGDLQAFPINASTGEVSSGADAEVWSAGDLLLARDWTNRVIATSNGSNGVGFTATAVGSTVNPSGVYGSNDNVINYLRGERSNEGTLFRTRNSLIGAIINSEPAVSRTQNVVYVQSGEGMLHAFDTKKDGNPGKELWAFVPRSVLGSIGETVKRGYAFSTKLDGSPTLGTIAGGTTLLVAGTGAAGRSFHALDVSEPRNLTEAQLATKVRWEFPTAGDSATQAKVGLALGRPQIVKLGGGNFGVLLTSGYNSDDGGGRLWLLELNSDGSIDEVHAFDTGAGSSSADAGLAQVSGYLENDGSVRYVYGGDLLGNLWRFDLQVKDAPFKLATLLDDANQPQPVTTAPELVEIEGQRIVIVGTGRLLGISDFGKSDVQTMYAIADGTVLLDARHSLVEQVYSSGTITSNAVDFATARGWYVDLPAGEQANTRPTVAHGVLAFVTNTAGESDCSASSKLYKLNLLTGGGIVGSEWVSSVISETANASAVTALLTKDGKVIGAFQDADGNPDDRELSSGQSIKPAKNSWREIRR